VVLLVDKDQIKFELYGILLSMLSALGYALYIVTSKRQIKELTPLMSTLMVAIGNCFAFGIFAKFTGSFSVPHGLYLWYDIVGIAIICTAIPIILFLECLKYLSSTKASILSVLEPVAVVMVGILLLGEHVTVMQALGMMIILAGAIVVL
jgi:drug/metabolite transporter (DMT)-like permease